MKNIGLLVKMEKLPKLVSLVDEKFGCERD